MVVRGAAFATNEAALRSQQYRRSTSPCERAVLPRLAILIAELEDKAKALRLAGDLLQAHRPGLAHLLDDRTNVGGKPVGLRAHRGLTARPDLKNRHGAATPSRFYSIINRRCSYAGVLARDLPEHPP